MTVVAMVVVVVVVTDVVPLMLIRAQQAASLIKESSLARVSGVAVIGNEGGKNVK